MNKSTTKTEMFVKHLQVRPGQFQFFQHEFADAVMQAGVKGMEEKNCSGWIRKEYYLAKGMLKSVASVFGSRRKDIIIVPCRGDDMHYKSLVYYPNYEIVPMLWDAWPVHWPKTCKALKMLHVKLCFCSSRQVASLIKEKLGIQTVWMPEGIDIRKYEDPLKPLAERCIDVFELGRHYDRYHAAVEKLIASGTVQNYRGKQTDADGNLTELAFPTAESLIEGMRDVKCIPCFPRCMTHPQVAGDIETLTIRYWECMLSGCLIVGHAPQELIDVVGYNPVIEVDWTDAEGQLTHILTHIEQYEELVQKNHQTALNHASWDNRMPMLLNTLEEYISSRR